MEAIEIAAKLMELSAKTAPKSKGVNFVQTRVLIGDVLQQLADEMVRFGERTGKKDFDRDAKGVSRSEAVVLIGLKDSKAVGLDCGACGLPGLQELRSPSQNGKRIFGPGLRFPAARHGHRPGLGRQDRRHAQRGQPHHVPDRDRGSSNEDGGLGFRDGNSSMQPPGRTFSSTVSEWCS